MVDQPRTGINSDDRLLSFDKKHALLVYVSWRKERCLLHSAQVFIITVTKVECSGVCRFLASELSTREKNTVTRSWESWAIYASMQQSYIISYNNHNTIINGRTMQLSLNERNVLLIASFHFVWFSKCGFLCQCRAKEVFPDLLYHKWHPVTLAQTQKRTTLARNILEGFATTLSDTGLF